MLLHSTYTCNKWSHSPFLEISYITWRRFKGFILSGCHGNRVSPRSASKSLRRELCPSDFPGASLKTKPISLNLLGIIRVRPRVLRNAGGSRRLWHLFKQTVAPRMRVEAEKGNIHISFRLMRGCALGQRMLWSRCLRSGSAQHMNNIISPRWCVQVFYYSSRRTI